MTAYIKVFSLFYGARRQVKFITAATATSPPGVVKYRSSIGACDKRERNLAEVDVDIRL